MSTVTSTSRNLEIEGMSGETCVKKVKSALAGISGATVQNVKVGAATITADQETCDSACAAVDAAGYKCHESGSPSTQGGSANATGRNGAARETNQQSDQDNNTPAQPSKYGAASRDGTNNRDGAANRDGANNRDGAANRDGSNTRENDNARDGAGARATNLARDNATPQDHNKKGG